MRIVRLHNFRRGLATNSSSTHSLIYRNEGELFEDLNIFNLDFYDRYDNTIAASREAKIKYVLANIMYNEPLVRIMASFYPEMKEYFPEIKKSMESGTYGGFGMCSRGDLNFDNNIEASVDYLRHVIDTDDIIIVGGSDEEDFVWMTTEKHVECPDPSAVHYNYQYKKQGVTKNGNYWVGYGSTTDLIHNDGEDYESIKNSFRGRIRFSTSETDDIVPEYPELIDLKITNMCSHGCPMCFVNATRDGAHAEIDFMKSFISGFGEPNKEGYHRVEFSIGGGNILCYPHLEELFEFMHNRGHIINVTIKADDCVRVLRDEPIRNIFKKYVDGIGISVFNVDDVNRAIELNKENMKRSGLLGNNYKHVVLHVIPEYIGLDMVEKIAETVTKNTMYVPILYLGYKTTGRGANQAYTHFTDEDLDRLFKRYRYIEIDTTFANRYYDYISRNFACAKTLTRNEGEFSMFIDGVEQNAYKSSYELDKPYNMSYVPYARRKETPMYNVKQAFSNIRKDCGFITYDELNDHYYCND